MNKGEFLEGLRERLSGELPDHEVREHLRYYENYLNQEIQSGKTEEEAVETLGNPYLIAKTILDMEEQEESDKEGRMNEESRNTSYYNEGYQETYGKTKAKTHHREIRINTWYAKLISFVVVMLLVILIFTVVGSLMALMIRFLFPILIITLVLYLFKKGKSDR
ncbi:MAG: DUF1700 domain-containing protein [Lachnospiraceae bacterium]|nr:DUF1700 domain-containing protein [Lachnospiraceae bacterium]